MEIKTIIKELKFTDVYDSDALHMNGWFEKLEGCEGYIEAYTTEENFILKFEEREALWASRHKEHEVVVLNGKEYNKLTLKSLPEGELKYVFNRNTIIFFPVFGIYRRAPQRQDDINEAFVESIKGMLKKIIRKKLEVKNNEILVDGEKLLKKIHKYGSFPHKGESENYATAYLINLNKEIMSDVVGLNDVIVHEKFKYKEKRKFIEDVLNVFISYVG